MNLPKRKKIRLECYDYSQEGAYFITICTYNRAMLFGRITEEGIVRSEDGMIVEKNIEKMNRLYPDMVIDKFIIMPNHIHMIITIRRERIVCVPKDHATKSKLSKTIQIFKSSITKELRNLAKERNACNAFPTIWQSHFHDHIIRNQQEYEMIWNYIDTNPWKWTEDRYFQKEGTPAIEEP